jgi:acylphosphatase
MSDKSVHVRIEGKVQRVWFRAWTVEQAKGLGLRGWVRNRHDGTVEAVFSGPAETVDRMLQACHQGPPKASVSAVKAEPTGAPQGTDFLQLPDA